MVQTQLTVEPFASKLNSVLEKNSDFEKIKFYSKILKRETLELKDDPKLPVLLSCTQLPLGLRNGLLQTKVSVV
ncbi:Hypothetical protein FKW44_008544 [Caligus rogercresseyi]|uniref:Uncharacterized protein n=1 Tax=Caligus rogercresseyi TaxID=217165 RepID=A0A7T8KGK4_CALRO|nr:Hypothetical protein FKW44_008544 [Caligus rogercresseyi]